MGFFKSFFSGKPSNPEEEQQKNKQKNFDIFKYDGMRAQRMGRADYAIKCFQEALALQEDFETMGYLVQVYIQTNQLAEARRLLERMAQIEKTIRPWLKLPKKPLPSKKATQWHTICWGKLQTDRGTVSCALPI